MTCPTCTTPMLLGESGWVCPRAGCEQRIVPVNMGKHRVNKWGEPIKPKQIKHNQTPEQRGEAIRRGVEGMG